MGDHDHSWHLDEGAAITPRLTALRLLGGGDAYEAYLAFDQVTYGPVVVKVLRPDRVSNGDGVAALQHEVEALERVRHPVVVRTLRYELQGPRPHIVLEHVEGPRLSSLLRRHGALQEHGYLPLALELASALHYFRQVGLVHLDIKPGNIIMGAPARLIDLSIARSPQAAAALTQPVGTDAYMAPEQCAPRPDRPPGPASDVWGVGATLFHAIEGTRAFEGDREADDPVDRWPQLIEDPPPFTVHVRPEVASAVMACLATAPEDRPTPEQLAEALQPAIATMPRGRLAFRVR